MKPDAFIIHFAADGNAKCLWTELIPLSDLGNLKVTRASTIEFNNALARWEVRLAAEPDRIAYHSPFRSVCLQWEVNELNRTIDREEMLKEKSA